jgi:CheY-like chemotaxis protein
MGSRPEHTERELATAFLASVSHELRTPLNAVLGMLELSLDEPLSPILREYLATACDSARTLAANLNLMLELAQVDTRAPRVSDVPLDFQQIIYAALNRLPQATRDRVQTRLSPMLPERLFGDDEQLEQLLSTLVQHSARWLEHPTIIVEVGGSARSPTQFTLEIGISEHGLAALDQRASLVPYDPVETSKYASPGLALAVVRRWLDRVGGKLETDSHSAGGRFVVAVPVSRSAPPAESTAKTATIQQQQQQQHPHEFSISDRDSIEVPLDVLVVDDTEANQKVVRAALAKRGHRVSVAGDGQQALEQVRRRSFDVVLMDAQMPLMNGFEATAAIRKIPEANRSHVPIIAMTAHALQEDRLRCLAAGMDDYLAKPIDVATLVTHVEFYGHAKLKSKESPNIPNSQTNRPLPTQDFLAGARARLAGDESLLLELIRLFRQDATSLLEKIAAGLRSNDSDLSSRAAHNLRGLAANFDDACTIKAAGAVEKLAIDGAFELASKELDSLRYECGRLIEALTDYERRVTVAHEPRLGHEP